MRDCGDEKYPKYRDIVLFTPTPITWFRCQDVEWFHEGRVLRFWDKEGNYHEISGTIKVTAS